MHAFFTNFMASKSGCPSLIDLMQKIQQEKVEKSELKDDCEDQHSDK